VIIDFHTHIFAPEVIKDREALLKKEEWFGHLYSAPNARMTGASGLIAEMDRCGIDRAVVCGFAWESFELYQKTNTYIAEAVARYAGRLVGFCNVPPRHPQAGSEIERCLALGLKGIGELKAEGQGFDLDDETSLAPVLEQAKKHDLPLLIHISEPVGRIYPGKGRTSPRKAYEFALRHPELKLVYAHWGGGLPFYELMPEVHGHLANVWYDCSASPYLYDPAVYRLALSAAGSDKILFGSDFPLISPERYFQEIDSLGLPEADRQAIMGLNGQALLESVGA
jgi:hypothetical protein